MPYVVRGKTVYKRSGKKKATAKSKSSAGKMVRLLRAIEYGGFKPRRRK